MQQTLHTTPVKKSGVRKFIALFFLLALITVSVIIWWRYFYVFGEGVKSGELNYVVKKGNLFKTYEGKLIQSGIRSRGTGSVASYEFEFSVVNDSIANFLMNNGGKYFDLHYKEYKKAVPWRGYTPYVVDRIVNSKEIR